MNWLDTYRDPERAARLVIALKGMELPTLRFMEVCGTHTVAICRHGLRDLLPPAITLSSGPGCPVCVTATVEIDRFIKAATIPGVIIATFGDLLRVPGSISSLQKIRGQGADIRMVYSTLDALAIARQNPDRQVIFLGVGFETTTPTVAAAILTAAEEGLRNFSVISAHKLMPPALTALVGDPEIRVDGLICPGHVSIMIGARSYQPLAEQYKIPCVIAGFEPVDILQAVAMLARQVTSGEAKVEVAYQRAVTADGNCQAMAIMHRVFEPVNGEWRGLATIPDSGLAIRAEFAAHDAEKRFDLTVAEAHDPAGCACGDVLKSIILPSECRLFGTACRPERPIGPCMVSGEGACGAYYKYIRPRS
ncbi:MAG: hydrogenase formation protein HypD [Deltaproteobacteria bacterium RIFOXYD12_FULL_57_12]|nr:MAG: hydrogenase formation protein HypD [Deltaproteobacteria bacterium RIFOXYD12_FULL_57_12]